MQSKTFSRLVLTLVIIVTILVVVYGVFQAIDSNPVPRDLLPEQILSTLTASSTANDYIVDIKTPKGVIHAIVASTSEQVERGLSWRNSLAKDAGMIFYFSTPDKYGFWMKDMIFPLDIVWIDSAKVVVGVDRNLTPESFPEVYYPVSNIEYVLELNSGGALDYGIATGTKLVF